MDSIKSDNVIEKMNELDIFTRKDYTYVEYVDQLKMFQEEAAKIVFGEKDAQLVRMNEIISRCETLSRGKNLYHNKKVQEGINALYQVDKSIRISFAGKHAEDRVANTFQFVTRPDASFYRNVFVTDGQENTELDTVVLTKNGFIILEIKNAKEDITIDSDGRILFNNSSCYHDISIGEKMDLKRRLFGRKLEKEFVQNGLSKDIVIDSFVVFSNPKGKKIQVNDRFKKEKNCFRGVLYNKIDHFCSGIEYTEEELKVLNDIMQKIEIEQKGFSVDFDPEKVKRAFADAIEVLTSVPGPVIGKATMRNKIVYVFENAREKTIAKKQVFQKTINSYSKKGSAVSLLTTTISGIILAPVALSGVLAGTISKA